ncbi:YdcF family protein [Mucilaginibacter sp. E4BP6]|uniref:YdcF family protein n=1 Tax=Mucilaginibacter sp. E4BP6 TaxID=2723089 RepID=UPI0015CAA40D|nr:YdcF family protein [Mucilaginibacter sp. E4BP6]NYE65596.1 hypothetical protein [Mucilaginibacter sp. E4BP6]
MMRRLSVLILGFLFTITANAQSTTVNYQLIKNGSVQAKNFYLLTLLQNDPTMSRVIETDPILSHIALNQKQTIVNNLNTSLDYRQITTNLKLTSQQIEQIGAELSKIYNQNKDLQSLVKYKLIPSKAYIHYENLKPRDQLIKAWQQDAEDINHTIAVYADGEKPNYPDIDSVSFNVHNKNYINIIKQATRQIIKKVGRSNACFIPSMTAALTFLDINNRNDAGIYEPMETTVNKAALQKANRTNWKNYKYTVLLVPGEGPDDNSVQISKGSIARCKLAATAYIKGLAPFIMVSGGRVHPYKTRYVEAVEMKKYMVDSLMIPAKAIIIEPHARHTTTNLRNASRLLIQYHFPLKRPALVITDVSQSIYISNMAERCIQELGDVPYRLGERVSLTSQEFYALPSALQINPWEPLDP